MRTAKFWVGLAGAVASSLIFAFSADSIPGRILGAVVAVAGAIGVYLTPNTPSGPTRP